MANLRKQADLPKSTCALPSCERPHYGRGYCRLHYRRLTEHGDAEWLPPSQGGRCKIDDCEKPSVAKDLCQTHYQKERKYGDPLADKRRKAAKCSVDGCSDLAHGNGYCRHHWERWRKYGDPLWERPVNDHCTVDGCDRPLGPGRTSMCEMHYCRLWRTGSVELGQRQCECGAPLTGTYRHCAACRLRLRRQRARAEYKRRRASKRGARYEIFKDEEIYERDGWRCGICHRKVNKRLKWPHRMSASLDHIIPLIEGGWHVRSNVQLAHLTCNASKNRWAANDQLLLFG